MAHLQQYFKDVPVVVCNTIKPEDDAKVAVEWLSQLPYESIAVVCHMNVVAHMAEILTSESFIPIIWQKHEFMSRQLLLRGFQPKSKVLFQTHKNKSIKLKYIQR